MMWNSDPFDEIHPQERKHHVLVLMFLVLLALLFSIQVVFNIYAITDEKIAATLSNSPFPIWAYGMQALCGAMNLMWISAIFFWQRIGYYGFVVTSLGMMGINLYCGMEPKFAGLPLVLVGLMFLTLHFGSVRSTWSQMR